MDDGYRHELLQALPDRLRWRFAVALVDKETAGLRD